MFLEKRKMHFEIDKIELFSWHDISHGRNRNAGGSFAI